MPRGLPRDIDLSAKGEISFFFDRYFKIEFLQDVEQLLNKNYVDIDL